MKNARDIEISMSFFELDLQLYILIINLKIDNKLCFLGKIKNNYIWNKC